ncbi:MAG: ThuA domain-containing protein [Planctomycetota bacterium]
MRLSRFSFLACALLAVLGLGFAAKAADEAKIQALIITGDDVGPHEWKKTTPVMKEILDKSGKFDVTVVEGFSILDKKEDLQKYGVILWMLFNAKKVPISDAAKENLVAFVKDGKGIVFNHFASGSFPQWPEWVEMCGRYWGKGSGHNKRVPFEVKVVAKDDPIMKGIENFKTDDELYAALVGDAKIKVLAEADSDFSHKTEPMVWTIDYGKGRVLHHTFGHDAKAFATPEVQKIIVRGCQWAATGKVTE